MTIATLIGVCVDFTSLDPIKLLFWSAVLNGIIAVPMIIAMMVLVSSPARMRRFGLPPILTVAGWATAALMVLVLVALCWSVANT